MKQKKRNKNTFVNAIIDHLYLIGVFCCPILAVFLFKDIVLDNIIPSIKEINLFLIKMNAEKIYEPLTDITKLIILILLMIMCLRKLNEKKVFAKGIKGEYLQIVYVVAEKIYGYKTVETIYKAIPTQLMIYKLDVFKKHDMGECIDENSQIEYKSETTQGDDSEINLLIGDTYPISVSKIDEIYKCKTSIIINRKQHEFDGIRNDGTSLVLMIQKELNKYKNLSKPMNINLFAYTNAQSIKKINDFIFNTKRNEYVVKAYYNNCDYMFLKDKYRELKY